MWKTLHQILCVRKKNLQSASDLNQFIASIDDIDDLLNDKIKLLSSQIGLTDRNTVDFVLKKHEQVSYGLIGLFHVESARCSKTAQLQLFS